MGGRLALAAAALAIRAEGKVAVSECHYMLFARVNQKNAK